MEISVFKIYLKAIILNNLKNQIFFEKIGSFRARIGIFFK
jgi:hypothetical protein